MQTEQEFVCVCVCVCVFVMRRLDILLHVHIRRECVFISALRPSVCVT